MKPEAIPEWIKHRFDQVTNAAKNGHLALLSAVTAEEGHQVYILAAVVPEGDEFNIIPFGDMRCPPNPYEAYVDPSTD